MTDVPCPSAGWKENNTGKVPRGARGKRVRVVLVGGGEGRYDENPMTPPGWAADGKGGCRWTLTESEFDIAWYLIL